jgi:methylmalonyl-CoA/ethylmalonyl-CoA epimerase
VISGLSFVGILVSDIEAAVELYSSILGVRPWESGVVEMPGVKAVMFPVEGCPVELLQPTVGPEAELGGDLARLLAKRGEGFCRLGVWVDDLDAEAARLNEAGFSIVDPGNYADIGKGMNARMAFVHPKSASGVLVELDQRT